MAALAEFTPLLAKHNRTEQDREAVIGEEKNRAMMEVSECLFLREPLDAVSLLVHIWQKCRMECLCNNAERFLEIALQGTDEFMDCFSSP